MTDTSQLLSLQSQLITAENNKNDAMRRANGDDPLALANLDASSAEVADISGKIAQVERELKITEQEEEREEESELLKAREEHEQKELEEFKSMFENVQIPSLDMGSNTASPYAQIFKQHEEKEQQFSFLDAHEEAVSANTQTETEDG